MHHLGVLRWRASIGNSFTAILKSGEWAGENVAMVSWSRKRKPVGGAKTLTRTVKIAVVICVFRHLHQ